MIPIIVWHDFFLFLAYIYKRLWQTRKSPKQQEQPTEDIPVADNKDIMVITGIKIKYLSLKENEYGHNHFFIVLGITPLQQLVELRKSMKMSIWDYNDKFYLNQWFKN